MLSIKKRLKLKLKCLNKKQFKDQSKLIYKYNKNQLTIKDFNY